jgi:PAS domain S-box-containing protein
MLPPISPDEATRLAAVRKYYILDTPPEAAIDRLTNLAARLFSVPIACVTLIDEHRLWFKSAYGLEIQEMPRGAAICEHTIRAGHVMVVPNAPEDPRFGQLPLVQGLPGIRFYAGAPLRTPEGIHIGTLCIIDTKPRPPLTADQQEVLRSLADTVMDELELRVAAITSSRAESHNEEVSQLLADVTDQLRVSDEMLRSVLDVLPVGVWIADKDGNIIHGNPAARAIWGGSAYVQLQNYDEYLAWSPETGQRLDSETWALARAIRNGDTSIGEVIHIRSFDGKDKIILNSAVPMRGPSGEITGAISVNEDITEQRRADDALRRTRDELELLIDASPIAIASFDRSRKVQRWNRAAERMFGWRHDEVIGRPLPIVPENLLDECERNHECLGRGVPPGRGNHAPAERRLHHRSEPDRRPLSRPCRRDRRRSRHVSRSYPASLGRTQPAR